MVLAATDSLYNIYNRILSDSVSKGQVEPFKDYLSNLPGGSTELFGFENQLGLNGKNSDIAICFSKENFNALGNWCNCLSFNLGPDTYWSVIGDIAAGKGNSLRESLNLVWIELDRPECNKNGMQEPGFFLELLRNKTCPEFVCSHVIPILTGNQNHPACVMVDTCLSMLPENAQLIHLGYFPTRSTEKLRITISFNDYHEISPYCSRIFKEGLSRKIQTRIDEFSAYSDFGVLHLDIGTEIENRLGIEMRFQENEQNPEYQWRWHEVFSMLTRRGLCLTEEAQSILGFSGTSRYIDETTFSPSWYRYFLYYVKGVFDFSGKEHYKAYCAYRRLLP